MRIAIVNDMPMAVRALREALSRRPSHVLAWIAGDGQEAVNLCARDTPDLVLMDLLMPGLDGVEATRRIMEATPCPILIVTGDVGARAAMVFEAMGAGALDAVDSPSLTLRGVADTGFDPLLKKIDRIEAQLRDRPARRHGRAPVVSPSRQLVAIGASAGGPAALARLLGGLPADFPGAIVVVQHVDRQFAAGMAQWLGDSCGLPVRLAQDGEDPRPGTVLLAATNDHLVLDRAGRLAYTAEPEALVYRPSVDVLFHSVCRHWAGSAIGVLLTGMGRDGAEGLKAMRDRGHHTIAQDRASCAVYGMPKAARQLDAACEILPLDQIADRLVERLRCGGHPDE